MAARELQAEKLRIVHVFRAPLGGLFRHVVDLAIEQAARGHEVGVFFDSGGAVRACRRTPSRAFPAASRSASGLPDPAQSRRAATSSPSPAFRVASPGPSGRGARPRLEGRRLRPTSGPERNAGRADPRLYAARRQLQLSPRLAGRIASTWGWSACWRVRPTYSCSKAPISPDGSTQYVGVREGCAPNRRQWPRRGGIRSRRARRRRRRPALCRGAARGQGHRHAARGACRWWRALAARRRARSWSARVRIRPS